jgi:hypothetical protein
MVSSGSLRHHQLVLTILRLLEYGSNYYNVKEFPEGETKTALMRVLNKKQGRDDSHGKRKKKQRDSGIDTITRNMGETKIK